MFAGTGSDVGKSIIAAAFCRIFKQDGYQPAPFKAQNMALNSFATPEGLEIGRAQAVQAEAAGVPCHTDMNPLLLKPQSDHTSQVVLNGRPIGNRDAYDYFRKEGREELRREVCAAYDRLAVRYNPIVLEGAGSISEINLRDTDLVNLPMALHAGADVILVGDIDRGGVFASVYGSLMLLRPHERERIKGILINKFRGDIRLFESGIAMLEELCGVPVVGVVPYYRDIYIEEEDSVALATKSIRAEKGKVNIAVILLRHLSNFTDFNVLERDPRVHLFYTNNVDELAKADIILLPEMPYDIDRVCEAVERRAKRGSNFSIIAVAEGAMNVEEARMKRKDWMAKRAEQGFGATATNRIAQAVQKKTGMETRVCIPGHMQRGGSPSAYDRVLATQFGSYAAKLVEIERYGVTVAMVNGHVTQNRLVDIAGKTRNVPEGCELLTVARRMGISLG